MQLPTFSWMLPGDLRGFFPEAEKVADMAKPHMNERLAGAANLKSETVIWDDVVPKLVLRDRLGRSTWIVQWRLDGTRWALPNYHVQLHQLTEIQLVTLYIFYNVNI